MVFSNIHLTSSVPIGYLAPSFPSLYWPINPGSYTSVYLYYPTDIWKFTLFWTLILYGVCFLTAGVWGWCMTGGGRENASGGGRSGPPGSGGDSSKRGSGWWWGSGWVVAGVVVGGIEAVLAGSVVGLILAAVYNAGFFRMSTWIPCVWGVINILVLILSSFSLQGGL